MIMFEQSHKLKVCKYWLKEHTKDLKYYLSLKHTKDINRTKLAETVKKHHNLKLEVYNQAIKLFPSVNWLEYYNI